MSTLSNAFCVKCHEMYNLETRKMCVGKCSHSICEPCFDRKLSGTCPICEIADAFEDKIINWEAHKSISAFIESMSLVETEDDSVETQILRVRSIAVCSDCALDGSRHKGHELIFVSKIKKFEEAFRMLEFLSTAAFFLKNLVNEGTGFKEMEWDVKSYSLFKEWTQFAEHLLNMAESMNTMDEHLEDTVSLSKNLFLCLEPILTPIGYYVKQDMEKSIKLMQEAEELEEKENWRKISEKLESLHIFFSTRETRSDLKSAIIGLVDVFQSGSIRRDLNVDFRQLVKTVKDVRRTFKLPQQYEGYANVAESVLQFFWGDTTK
ncbi:Protein CBG26284 [Caenorhabditis briggsae]|uniref:Protein CBG26284 n=1 Tax=Caenorhabditis briggsae TaxID=6238 RepID=B6ILY2_CAEBR|nr:Protein CBG26284 [Caenorhabditis briggsae]CAS00912.1 Protein CBG26284 [Caenorhabditis briggsae]